MTDERFNELLNGPLAHPFPMFAFQRLAMALRAVVDATGHAGEQALERHCETRDHLDRAADGERPLRGPCCACGAMGHDVRNVLMLTKKAPTPGTGWGCAQCGTPMDGALAVLCDECVLKRKPIRWACKEGPSIATRVPIDDLRGSHGHDYSKHPEVPPEDAEQMKKKEEAFDPKRPQIFTLGPGPGKD